MRGISDLHIVGADVVEVAPAYDWAGITATAAAQTIYEFISIFAAKVDGAPAPEVARQSTAAR